MFVNPLSKHQHLPALLLTTLVAGCAVKPAPQTTSSPPAASSLEKTTGHCPASELNCSNRNTLTKVDQAWLNKAIREVQAWRPEAEQQASLMQAKPLVEPEQKILALIRFWQTAWSQQNWDNYRQSYLQNTALYGVNVDPDTWRQQRKDRLLGPEWIKVTISTPRLTRIDKHWYKAEFQQLFQRPGYKDQATKILDLAYTRQGWRIASEATLNSKVLYKAPEK